MPVMLRGIDGIKAYAGFHLGNSCWLEITQDMINEFAAVTDDKEWLHVDEERARSGPFGKTIAHGYLTLSLVIPLLKDIYVVEDVGMGLNYGINRLRFTAPVPVNSNVRLSATLKAVEPVDQSVQVTLECIVECDATAKPALVAELVFRYWPEAKPLSS